MGPPHGSSEGRRRERLDAGGQGHLRGGAEVAHATLGRSAYVRERPAAASSRDDPRVDFGGIQSPGVQSGSMTWTPQIMTRASARPQPSSGSASPLKTQGLLNPRIFHSALHA